MQLVQPVKTCEQKWTGAIAIGGLWSGAISRMSELGSRSQAWLQPRCLNCLPEPRGCLDIGIYIVLSTLSTAIDDNALLLSIKFEMTAGMYVHKPINTGCITDTTYGQCQRLCRHVCQRLVLLATLMPGRRT